MAAPKQDPGSRKPRRRPATTPEERENQMISLAVDLAESQMKKGTASAAVITHFLKLATSRESLEQDKLRRENDLLRAKVEALASSARIEDMYDKALRAMRAYRGDEGEEGEEYGDQDLCPALPDS